MKMSNADAKWNIQVALLLSNLGVAMQKIPVPGCPASSGDAGGVHVLHVGDKRKITTPDVGVGGTEPYPIARPRHNIAACSVSDEV